MSNPDPRLSISHAGCWTSSGGLSLGKPSSLSFSHTPPYTGSLGRNTAHCPCPLGEIDLPDWRVWEKKLCLRNPALPPLGARSGPGLGHYSKKTIISICAPKPHAASGYCNGQYNLRGCQLPSCAPGGTSHY